MEKYGSYKKGYFKAGDGHELYYECYGNPDGIPVLSIHGGPGAGFCDDEKKYYDPEIYNVVLYDQRGSGRSKPFASIKANTTQKLVRDQKNIIDFLGIEKPFLSGGSWGSTLALVFAIQHPELVRGLLVRGIFLANAADIRHYIQGGIKKFFPDVWDRFISLVPKKNRKDPASYYLKMMNSSDPEIKDKYTFEWAYYEIAISRMKMPHKKIIKILGQFSYQSLSPLEAHFMINKCFLEENYILKNASKLSHLPVTIIHGRYDFICLPKNAFDLHKKIKGSRLHIVCSGHSGSEKEIEKKIFSEMKRYETLI
ncbi:prolyl aminopeptidase [bacterium]|nr:prolyl aminopeptidase [bacterium]